MRILIIALGLAGLWSGFEMHTLVKKAPIPEVLYILANNLWFWFCTSPNICVKENVKKQTKFPEVAGETLNK